MGHRWFSNSQRIGKIVLGVLALVAPALLLPTQAIAAEQIVLKYNIFERSISVADLTELAERGRVSRELRSYLRMAGQRPRVLRNSLNNSVEVDAVLMDRLLNSSMGEFVLEQLTQYIHTPSRTADSAAMRSALTLAASDDGEISLLEVLQKYPTKEIHVDGNGLGNAYEQLQVLQGNVENMLGL
jgi:hypothetical protein